MNAFDENDRTSSAAMAHICSTDPSRQQTVARHLQNVSTLAQQFASKVNMPLAGKLLGLLHDFGKYSTEFQNYLFSANGFLDQDSDDFIDPVSHKGKIDHSTAGAQYLWRHFSRNSNSVPYAQMLALCIASHHSGLIDCIAPDGEDVFFKRMGKDDAKTHCNFCREFCDTEIRAAIKKLFIPSVMQEVFASVRSLRKNVKEHLLERDADVDECKLDNENSRDLQQGLLTRFLLSCLLDADRIDSAEFEDPAYKAFRAQIPKKPWDRLLSRLNKHLESFEDGPAINDARQQISKECEKRGSDPKGLFTLSVPTGGGKTLASLRFALRHAKTHDLERIVYIIPYTSIIDQNAQVARNVLEVDEEVGSIVLEHHSNILPEKETWQNKLLAENWDAPVVFTTMVQFLDSLFASGTRSARRMHNLARSVLIFDEIQTLPVKCLHLFCNALNFLVENCSSSAILCTATQPRLDTVPRPYLGSLQLVPEQEIISDVPTLFSKLRRTTFVDHCDQYMSEENIADLALKELHQSGSCLVVCNTKKWAENIYARCAQEWGETYYLSTNLCPAHRLDNLDDIRQRLAAGDPVLCVSTQLIECGVDVSFGSVIRLAAGLDSILQAAGRCNRHGGKKSGRVHIVKVREEEERLDFLPDIKAGRDIYLDKIRVGHAKELDASDYDLTRPEIISAYFEYYFHHRSKFMAYAVQNGERDDTLVNMLGKNNFVSRHPKNCNIMHQSFATAGRHFQVIDTPTQSVIVPYKKGKELIAALYSSLILSQKKELLREAQRYTVNVFPYTTLKLKNAKALEDIQQSGILCLDFSFYDDCLGVVSKSVVRNKLDIKIV